MIDEQEIDKAIAFLKQQGVTQKDQEFMISNIDVISRPVLVYCTSKVEVDEDMIFSSHATYESNTTIKRRRVLLCNADDIREFICMLML